VDAYTCIAIIITVTAVFRYLNARVLKMQPTIGVMLTSLAVAGVLLAVRQFGVSVRHPAATIVDRLDFGNLLLKGLLGFMLFAGAIHVNLRQLLNEKWQIGIFALVGVVASTFIIGSAVYVLAQWLSLPLDWLHCLLFGALISPTDPIAVLAILTKVGAPANLQIEITGESLFNDGVGVVMFLTLLQLTGGGT